MGTWSQYQFLHEETHGSEFHDLGRGVVLVYVGFDERYLYTLVDERCLYTLVDEWCLYTLALMRGICIRW